VRELQRVTGSVRAFAPLPRRLDPSQPTTGYWDSKVITLSRLALNDVEDIQVDWALYGPKLAQVALLFGANDVDGVSPDDDAGTGRRRAPLEEIVRNIRAASLEPVERDGRYERKGR
jgi:2-iminoacetate synthase ThiH